MKRSDAFEGNYIKKEDLERPLRVTIRAVEKSDIESDEGKERVNLMTFSDFHKPFIVKPTNWDILSEIFKSDDSDDWIGKTAELYIEPNVSYGGKRIGGIRFRAVNGTATTNPAPSDSLKSAKAKAWTEWIKTQPPATSVPTMAGALAARIKEVYGKPADQLNVAEWEQFYINNFRKPLEQEAEEIFGGVTVAADDCPI